MVRKSSTDSPARAVCAFVNDRYCCEIMRRSFSLIGQHTLQRLQYASILRRVLSSLTRVRRVYPC